MSRNPEIRHSSRHLPRRNGFSGALRRTGIGLSILVFFPFCFSGEAQSPSIKPDGLERGSELAHIVCQTCHLFPEPGLLDKRTWLNGALMRMAPLMGVGRINLDKRPDGAILKEAGIFPTLPIISEADWRSICEYYHETAPSEPLPRKTQPTIQPGLQHFLVRPLKYPGSTALVTMVKIDPGTKRIFVGNAGARTLDILDSAGGVMSRVPVDSPPVSLTLRPEGLYVTLIGNVFPSDERKGKLVLIERRGDELRARTLLEDLQRPASAALADLNGDGREDIIVGLFGNYIGRFAWFENLGASKYREHSLLEWPGSVNSIVLDANKDGRPDIFVLMAQAREGIHLFLNQGGGKFENNVLASFHPAFGSTHLELADFNGDGFPDLLVTNGDNGEYPSPFKNYHGIRIFLNDGHNQFTEAWLFPMNGAFKAMAADFDGDGDLDIAAISFFPDYQKSPQESFVYLENKGGFSFEAFSFPECTSGRWLTMDVGDIDGDGDPDIVLGSFAEGPRSIPISAGLQASWQTNNSSVLLLENRRAK